MKRLIVIPVFLFYGLISTAQEKYCGINLWNNNELLLTRQFNHSFSEYFGFGVNVEYIPKKAWFSLSGEIQYFFKANIIMFPISLNFIPGNKFKLRIKGGIMPVVQITPIDPNKIFGIGWDAGFGFDVKLSASYILCCNVGTYCVPIHDYHTNHFGSTYEEKYMYYIGYLSLGVNYLINTNNN